MIARRAILAALLVLFLGPRLAMAAGDDILNLDDSMLVMDWSESMWAPVESDSDVRRYQVAKSVSSRLVRQMTRRLPGHSLGLTLFGRNGTEPQCEEIETLQARRGLAEGAAIGSQLAALIEGLPAPKTGNTPLIGSIERAAAQLPDGGSIIIVSDFIETCTADGVSPCQAYAALRQSGKLEGVRIRFILAPVGRQAAIREMEAFEGCTGATLLRVGPEGDPDINPARIVDLVVADLAKVAAITVRVAMDSATDLPPRWGEPPLDGRVSLSGRALRAEKLAGERLVLDGLGLGDYVVTVEIAGTTASRRIALREGGAEAGFTVAASRLGLRAESPGRDFEGAPPRWSLADAEGNSKIIRGTTAALVLPPGPYAIVLDSHFGTLKRMVDLRAGENREEVFRLEPPEPEPPADFKLLWSFTAIPPSAFAEGEAPVLDLRSAGAPGLRIAQEDGSALLPAGRYEAVLVWNGIETPMAPIAGESGEIVKLVVTAAPCLLRASPPRSAEGDVTWILTALASQQEFRWRGGMLAQTLPPGRYRLAALGAASLQPQEFEATIGGRIDLKF